MSKLNLALIWHMHQPFYRDPWSGITSMPWVRLHASKAYNDMAAALEQGPVKVAVNFSPSLIAQLNSLNSGIGDFYLGIALKPTDSLTEEERAFILERFFSVNFETMIKPYSRYRQIWEKRRKEGWRPGAEVLEDYTDGELRDLIVWFQLSWIGWAGREKYREVAEIEKRGWDFTEAEKDLVIKISLEIAHGVLDRWRALAKSGRVELTTSPYAHPILPLLIDTETARRCLPSAPLPTPFRYPEDAREQIMTAREVYHEVFNAYPCGMWPSEGSVAPEIIPLLAEAGIKWFATDEGILQKSLNTEQRGQLHYHPYLVTYKGAQAAALFRDRYLSDLIGFDYNKLSEKDAVTDMLKRLHDIASTTRAWEDPPLLTIALDGENPWEYYRAGGKEFLGLFYKGLLEMKDVETVLPCEWLPAHPPRKTIENLYSGSWIRSDYSVWIGDEEENEAWQTLLSARRDYGDLINAHKKLSGMEGVGLLGFLVGLLANIGPVLAKEELFAAEGSDWFWWYGDDFTSDNDEEFDRLFRKHLANVYRFLGNAPPEYLSEPILRPHPVKPDQEPVAFLHPTIDGKVTEYYEWNDGAVYTVRMVGGTMYTREVYLDRIYFGFDDQRWYLRFDRRKEAWDDKESETENWLVPLPDCVIIDCHTSAGQAFKIEIPAYKSSNVPCRLYLPDREYPELITPLAKVARDNITEMSIPFRCLDLAPGTEVRFVIVLERTGKEMDRYPPAGYLHFVTPDASFERKMWSA